VRAVKLVIFRQTVNNSGQWRKLKALAAITVAVDTLRENGAVHQLV